MEEDIETCGWFVFYKDQLLIEKKNGMYTIPFGTEPPMPVPVGSTIHTIGETHCQNFLRTRPGARLRK